MEPTSSFPILFVLILLSGFFSGAETALISLRPTQVRNMVKAGRRFADWVEQIKGDPQKLLITILIGNNIVNIGTSVLATVVATEMFGSEILALVTGVLTLVILVFGEILPKTFCHKNAETFSLIAAPPLLLLQKILFPVVWLLEHLIGAVNRWFRVQNKKEGIVSEEELKAMVNMGAEEGTLAISEAEMIDRAIGFGEIQVQQVMTPRADIGAIEENRTVGETLQAMIDEGMHSRLPVYRETIDYPVAVVTIREICQLYMEPSTKDKRLKELKLPPAVVAPFTQPIRQLYFEFRVKKTHMALVLDENGSVVGLVTLEDIVEEIMGEIHDETDSEETQKINPIGDRSWSVSGDMELQSIEKETGIWLGNKEEKKKKDENRKSLSLIFMEQFQKMPKPGKSITVNKFNLTVESMDRYKINRIRIDPITRE